MFKITSLGIEDSPELAPVSLHFLGWNKHTEEGFEKCRQMLEIATVYALDEDIAHKAIELRRKTKIKLADAIIAATAILNNFTIVTPNSADFKKIAEESILNTSPRLEP